MLKSHLQAGRAECYSARAGMIRQDFSEDTGLVFCAADPAECAGDFSLQFVVLFFLPPTICHALATSAGLALPVQRM